MKIRPLCSPKTPVKLFFVFGPGLLALVLTAGCSGSYGRVTFDDGVTAAFKTHQVPSDLKYYYYGLYNRHYALVGLDPKFELQTRIWRPIDPQSERFKEAVRNAWEIEHYAPYYARGSRILDLNGNQVGVYYSSFYVSVKFGSDNQIRVMPDSVDHEGFLREWNH